MNSLAAAVPGVWLEDLRQAVARTPAGERATVAQEALDVVAVAAGLKPAAILGRGHRDEVLMTAVAGVPASCGLIVTERRGWDDAVTLPDLPAWYAKELAQAAGEERILIVGSASRRAAWQQLLQENPDDDAIVSGLGYPRCCVAEFHRRRGRYHLITIAMLARQAAGDEGLLRRLVQAQVFPAPRGEAELQDLLQATRTVFAPFTSIAMCDVCERDADGPARRIGADFARLACSVGFDAWLTAPA